MVWGAEYQGAPAAAEGTMVKRDWLKIAGVPPRDVIARVRYWDKAGSTSASAKYTAGVRLAYAADGMIYIEHVVRGKWTTGAARRHVADGAGGRPQCADRHRAGAGLVGTGQRARRAAIARGLCRLCRQAVGRQGHAYAAVCSAGGRRQRAARGRASGTRTISTNFAACQTAPTATRPMPPAAR